MELIDKIRAEVEKKTHGEQGYGSGDAECGYRDCARDILSFLDTLEVKEVNLEEEIELIKGDYEQVDVAWNNDFDFIARHFFELGIKTKGEQLTCPCSTI